MTTRTTTRSVTFRRPFILGGFDAVQAAGTYLIDVEEEALESISFLAFRRTSTRMRISACGATEHRIIDPVELDEALLRDSAQPACHPVTEEGLKREKSKRVGARLRR